jgi:hypothetical protein
VDDGKPKGETTMAIKSVTKSGNEVVLTGTECRDMPTVRVEFTHPTLGPKSFESSSYGPAPGGNEGILGCVGSQRVCITVPRADFDAAMAEARAIGEREVADLKSGAAKIRLHHQDGEYLSGYAVHGRGAEVLLGLGLVKPVDGWGYLASDALAKALGEEFTYQQAAEFARPALEEKRAKEQSALRGREEKFAEASRTGKPVELRSWSEECCERDFDCSLDVVTEYALPDGATKMGRIHTH